MVNENGDRGVSNWALLGEIQAEGLRAAGALVERLVHLVDGPHGAAPDAPAADRTPPETPSTPDPGAILPWFDLWRDLVDRTADAVQRLQGVTDGPVVQVGGDGYLAPPRPLSVVLDTSGHARTEMWLHNGTHTDQGELVPQCGPLSDVEGNELGCDVTIDPPKIDGLPSRSSRGFTISLTSDPASTPGTYRGIVQVRGADAAWIPLEVVVPA